MTSRSSSWTSADSRDDAVSEETEEQVAIKKFYKRQGNQNLQIIKI